MLQLSRSSMISTSPLPRPRIEPAPFAERVAKAVSSMAGCGRVARGYVLKRELPLAEPVHDVLWHGGKLVVCLQSAVCVLSPDGTELRRWTTGSDPPQCAVVCESRGGEISSECHIMARAARGRANACAVLRVHGPSPPVRRPW